MIQIKKTILTLALLLTAATGARAAWTGGTYTATATENLGAITVNGDATLTINEGVTVTVTGGINVASGTLTVTGPGTLVVTGANGTGGGTDVDDNGYPGGTGGVAISGNIIVQGGATVTATGGTGGTGGNGMDNGGPGGNGGVAISGNIIVQGGASVTATGGNGGNGGNAYDYGGNGGTGGNAFAGTLTYKGGTVTANGGSGGSGGSGGDGNGSSGSAGKAFANDVDFTQTTGYSVTNGTSTIGSVLNQRKVVISGGSEPAAPSGPEVAWDKATKTGTFKMPGGNVTLEPEYYPQAELATGGAPTAINDVPATTDGAIVKAGTVATIGTTETAQGTVMYYVSPTALDDAALLALAADQWKADVPTAAHLTAGQAYVYYYVRGNDGDTDETTFSDGDILAANALTVTIAAAPTYAVTFADDLAEPTLWTASPNTGVTKGQTVTVTYTGTKKVLGVKAEKKAAAPATVLSGALVDGATIKVNFKWRDSNFGDYVQGVYNAASGTFTVSKGGNDWGRSNNNNRAVCKVEKSGDNIIIGAGFYDFSNEAMVWTFNTTNDTYTTTNGTRVNEFPTEYGLISVSVNGTDITSQLTAQ